MPVGLWRSGTTSWCTAAPSPRRPHSDRGPGPLPGLRGSTSASLWAPHTSETKGSHGVHVATHSPTHPQPVSPGCPKQPPALEKTSTCSRLTTTQLIDYIWWEKDDQKFTLKKKVETNPKQETVTVYDKPWLCLRIKLRWFPVGLCTVRNSCM